MYMSEGLEHGFTPQGGAPRWLTIAVIVLAGVSLVSIGLAWSASSRASSAQTAASTTIKQNLDTLNQRLDRKSTRLNSSHLVISYAVFCLKKKKKPNIRVVEQCLDAQDDVSTELDRSQA